MDEEIEYTEDTKVTHINSIKKEKVVFGLTSGKFRYHICPIGAISYDSDMFIKTYILCKDIGCLPQEGGLFNQDNRMMEAFTIINSEIKKHENSEMEKHNREMKQKTNAKQGFRT